MPPAKRPRGRPTKFDNPKVRDAIIESIANGNYKETSARANGIPGSTFRGWLERGEAEAEAGQETEYTKFRLRVIEAEALAEENMVACILKAATDGTWQASAWWLERVKPDRFARRNRVEVDAQVQSQVNAEVDVEVQHSRVVEHVPDDARRREIMDIIAQEAKGAVN